eukprot:gene2404-biopygen6784
MSQSSIPSCEVSSHCFTISHSRRCQTANIRGRTNSNAVCTQVHSVAHGSPNCFADYLASVGATLSEGGSICVPIHSNAYHCSN